MKLAALLLLVLLGTTGCATALAMAFTISTSVIGVLQRYTSRVSQDAQTAEIRALREEIARGRAPVVHELP